MNICEIAELIVSGFEKLVIYPGQSTNNYDACMGCADLLSAWNGLKIYMDEQDIGDVWELERRQIKEFRNYNIHPSFLFQLLGDELHNAGIEDKIYFRKRIEYCTDFLNYIGDDDLTMENTRRAIADSYFELGDEAECDRLYSEWLETDPKWGQGYVGWASNYENEWHGRKNTEKAASLYEKALGIDGIRDREDVFSQALSFFEGIGNTDKTAELRNELSQSQAKPPRYLTNRGLSPATSKKVGRNEPCPCGSGKKYKKCCGA